MAAPPTRDGPRVNEEIRIPQVRLIDQDGEMQGVLTVREAMQRAFAVGLDLVEISPNADPPVCKILDFGKFKYEQQKKRNEAKKKQKVIEIKEIKVRPNIDENDYQVKMRAMKSFIEEGDKVKVTLRFRGREMAHQDIGVRVLERIRAEMDTDVQGGANAADGKPPDGDGAVAEVAAGRRVHPRRGSAIRSSHWTPGHISAAHLANKSQRPPHWSSQSDISSSGDPRQKQSFQVRWQRNSSWDHSACEWFDTTPIDGEITSAR